MKYTKRDQIEALAWTIIAVAVAGIFMAIGASLPYILW